jgi:hypothetical protein
MPQSKPFPYFDKPIHFGESHQVISRFNGSAFLRAAGQETAQRP